MTASTPSYLLVFLYKTSCAYPCIITFSPGIIYLSLAYIVRPCSENARRKITQNSTEVDAETKESTRKTEEKLDGRYKEGHERKNPKSLFLFFPHSFPLHSIFQFQLVYQSCPGRMQHMHTCKILGN